MKVFTKTAQFAGIAQLVEHNLAKVGVGSSSLLSRSRFKKALVERLGLFFGQYILIFLGRHLDLVPKEKIAHL